MEMLATFFKWAELGQAANALENVPVLNEAVWIARPLIKDGLNLTKGAQIGTQKLQQLNGKLREVHIT